MSLIERLGHIKGGLKHRRAPTYRGISICIELLFTYRRDEPHIWRNWATHIDGHIHRGLGDTETGLYVWGVSRIQSIWQTLMIRSISSVLQTDDKLLR